VLGLYGIVYLDVARRPAQGWLVAAVALTGKILGPPGLAWLILTGTWPPDIPQIHTAAIAENP
jgi:hypothetical protein